MNIINWTLQGLLTSSVPHDRLAAYEARGREGKKDTEVFRRLQEACEEHAMLLRRFRAAPMGLKMRILTMPQPADHIEAIEAIRAASAEFVTKKRHKLGRFHRFRFSVVAEANWAARYVPEEPPPPPEGRQSGLPSGDVSLVGHGPSSRADTHGTAGGGGGARGGGTAAALQRALEEEARCRMEEQERSADDGAGVAPAEDTRHAEESIGGGERGASD